MKISQFKYELFCKFYTKLVTELLRYKKVTESDFFGSNFKYSEIMFDALFGIKYRQTYTARLFRENSDTNLDFFRVYHVCLHLTDV